MLRIAVLASGSGTNAERLVRHFAGHGLARVVLVGCDRPGAGVVQRAWDLGVPVHLFSGKDLAEGRLQRELEQQEVDLVVLAGFLRLVPEALVGAFPAGS